MTAPTRETTPAKALWEAAPAATTRAEAPEWGTTPAEALGPLGVPLVDLLDRVLATGVVISGDLVIAIAEVPLVRLSLHAFLSSVNERVRAPWTDSGPL
ncbi:gas vesicle protein [Streptomyces sp. 110]|uniref:Gas vesicle protein n=1 Tax=Streptomyces endocoffeicus TaxID=2898945 RepID=A0ABS1PXL7_9ACTN|nr:gas vesicle protein [Streptomyces endocoffeicus]